MVDKRLFKELCNQLDGRLDALEPEVQALVNASPAAASAVRDAIRDERRHKERREKLEAVLARVVTSDSLPPIETMEQIRARIAPWTTQPLDRPIARTESGAPVLRSIGADLLPDTLQQVQGVIGTPFSGGGGGDVVGFPMMDSNQSLDPYSARGLATNVGVFQQIERSDAVIAEGIDSVLSTATIGTWEFAAPEIDPALARVIGVDLDELARRADELNIELVRLGYDFTTTRAAQIRTGLICGFAIHEFGVDLNAPVGRRINWFSAREPNTVQDWIMSPAGRLLGFVQTNPNSGGKSNPRVDIRKCLYWARNNDGANWEGISAIRPAYGWDLLLHEFLSSAILHRQRFGPGVPVVRRAAGQMNGKDASREAMQAVANYANIDKAVLELSEGLNLEILQMQAEQGLEAIVRLCTEMKRAALGSALQATGSGGVGSYALADVKSRMQVAAIESFVQHPASAWSSMARGITSAIYGPQVLTPIMRVTGIATRTPVEVIEVHQKFADVALTGAYDRNELLQIAARADVTWTGTEDTDSSDAADVVDEIEAAQRSRSERHTPTAGMREEAERGLAWRREFGRGGTPVGVARARDIANGRNLPLDTVKRMHSFFSRHESASKQAQGFRPGEDGYPSAGRIAWALWGGDAGQTWAAAIVEREERATHAPSCGCGSCGVTMRAEEPRIRIMGRDGLTMTTFRALRPGEETVAWRSIKDQLDSATSGIERAVLEQQRLHRNAFVDAIRPLVESKQYSEIARVRVPWLDEYASAIERELVPLSRWASADMMQELAAQVESKTGAKGWRPTRQALRDDPATWAEANAVMLARKVDDATSERLANLALQAAHGGSIAALIEAEGSFGFATSALAAQAANATLNASREATATVLGPAVKATAVEVLDQFSCAPCREADGESAMVGSAEYERIKPPYRHCNSLDRTKGGANECRRVILYEVIASQLEPTDESPDAAGVSLFEVDASQLRTRSAAAPAALLILGPPGAGKSTRLAACGIEPRADIDDYTLDEDGAPIRGSGWLDEVEADPPRAFAYTGSSLAKTVRVIAAMRGRWGAVRIEMLDAPDETLEARVASREAAGDRALFDRDVMAAIVSECRATMQTIESMGLETVERVEC